MHNTKRWQYWDQCCNRHLQGGFGPFGGIRITAMKAFAEKIVSDYNIIWDTWGMVHDYDYNWFNKESKYTIGEHTHDISFLNNAHINLMPQGREKEHTLRNSDMSILMCKNASV